MRIKTIKIAFSAIIQICKKATLIKKDQIHQLISKQNKVLAGFDLGREPSPRGPLRADGAAADHVAISDTAASWLAAALAATSAEVVHQLASHGASGDAFLRPERAERLVARSVQRHQTCAKRKETQRRSALQRGKRR